MELSRQQAATNLNLPDGGVRRMSISGAAAKLLGPMDPSRSDRAKKQPSADLIKQSVKYLAENGFDLES